MKGLFTLYWGGVTDAMNVGHNKLPADVEFKPFEVSRIPGVSQ